jgi:integrase
MARKPTAWRYTAGRRPHRITVYEKEPGGLLYGRVWHPERGAYVKRSLGHTDQDRAEEWARQEAQRLATGRAQLTTGTTTLGSILDTYLAQHTPSKSLGEQAHDARRVVLFKAVFGADRDATTLDEAHRWEAYLAARRAGAITARGVPVPEAERHPLTGDRALEQECEWLCWVLAWATRRKQDGRVLLARAPSIKALADSVTGWPEPGTPRRPVASTDRYEALSAVADRVPMEGRAHGKRTVTRSYLPELLALAYHTGRRISAICALHYADVLDRDPTTGHQYPHGVLRWRATADKMGRETFSPMNRDAQAAIRRALAQRPGIGDAYLFPSPRHPERPISRHVADDWLRTAERLANLTPQPGSMWHRFRRSWATARKHLPAVDVAAAGGWSGVATLQTCYQQADAGSLLTVVTSPAELREVQGG